MTTQAAAGPLVQDKRTGTTHAVTFLGEVTGRTRCGWRFLHPSTALRVLPGPGPITCQQCTQ
jgi:hypothetical protein